MSSPRQAPAGAEPAVPRWALVLLVLAAVAAYANSFSGPFIFDDYFAIPGNASLRQWWPPWAPLLPPGELTVGGRPILNLSFALNYAVGGVNVWGYHAANLAIHVLAGLILFGVMRRTLGQPLLRGRFGADAGPLALAIALLWTLHPLQTESVTYLSQRAESLMGLFYLLTLYAFIRAAGPGPDARRWTILCVTACCLGMAAKEVMATAPLMVLLYDRTFVAGTFREALRQRHRLYTGLAASWLVLAYAFLDVGKRAIGFGYGVTPWQYAVTECGVIVRYLGLVFWPHPLVIDYGAKVAFGPEQVVPQALLLALLLAVTAVALARRAALGFAGAWFFLILAVTSSFIPVAKSPMAEHRLYLPLAALVTLVVLGLYGSMGRKCLLVVAVLAILCGVLTFERNRDYQSEDRLWQQTTTQCPDNARAHNNYGEMLLRAGQIAAAQEQFSEAVRLQPDYAEAQNNLGNSLKYQGRYAEAIGHYREALRLNPAFGEVHSNWADALMLSGETAEALDHYREACRMKPDNAVLELNWGSALMDIGKNGDAEVRFRKALEIDPNLAEAHYDLGTLLTRENRFSEALVEFEQAVRIKPGYTEAQINWGNVLFENGDLPGAIDHFQQAVRLAPDSVEAHNNLGNALAQTQDWFDAIAEYQEVVRLDPNFAPAHYNWGNILIQIGQPGEAVAQFEEALRLDPKYGASAYSNLGVALLQLGRKDEARAQFQKALSIEPGNQVALKGMAMVSSPANGNNRH